MFCGMPDPHILLVICPLVLLGGFVDAIAGGGGLITLPAYLLCGLPAHLAIGTNKMSAMVGTAFSCGRFVRGGYVDWGLALPAAACSLLASVGGAHLSMLLPEERFRVVLMVMLPVVAALTLRRRALLPKTEEMPRGRRRAVMCLVALVCGLYDGFYGPGTGTFLILGLSTFARLGVTDCAGQTKVINLAGNVSGFVTLALAGQSWIVLGAIASAFSVAGHLLGAGMVMRGGTRVVRPLVLCVLAALFIKTTLELAGLA